MQNKFFPVNKQNLVYPFLPIFNSGLVNTLFFKGL